MGNRDAPVKKYYTYEKIWKRETKALKKQNNILSRMYKISGSRR